MNDISLKYWIVCAFVLFVKMWMNSLIQGYCRMRNRQFVIPEDAEVFGRLTGSKFAPSKEEHPMVQRASNCWRNDLENIPIFLIISIGYVLAGGGEKWGAIYFCAFVVARIIHTVCYLASLQPWRNIAYLSGVVTTIAVAVHSVWLTQSQG